MSVRGGPVRRGGHADPAVRQRQELLHEAAATLGSAARPGAADRVWQRVLDRGSTAEELAKGRDLSTERHREVWTALYAAAGCEELAPGLQRPAVRADRRAPSPGRRSRTAVPTLRGRTGPAALRVAVVSDTGLRPAAGAGPARASSPHLDAVRHVVRAGRVQAGRVGVPGRVRPARRTAGAGADGRRQPAHRLRRRHRRAVRVPAAGRRRRPDRAGSGTCCRCSECGRLAAWRTRGPGLRGRAQRGPGSADAIAHGDAPAPVDGRTLVAVFSSPVARSLHALRPGRPASGPCCYEPEPDKVTEADRRLADVVVSAADPAVAASATPTSSSPTTTAPSWGRCCGTCWPARRAGSA